MRDLAHNPVADEAAAEAWLEADGFAQVKDRFWTKHAEGFVWHGAVEKDSDGNVFASTWKQMKL